MADSCSGGDWSIGATRRVQPLQLHELVPSAYCRVWCSMLGFESEAKLQTRVMFLFISVVKAFVPLPGVDKCDQAAAPDYVQNPRDGLGKNWWFTETNSVRWPGVAKP